ncbi:MAG TPA: ABC transporter permease, partial [Chryseolinea sp.]|nr:ABC transporter permease [Chryseolinea sp.]
MDEQELRNRPPKWADDFLAWACEPDLIEEVQGDLHEAFHKRRKESGLRFAKLLFIADVIRSLLSTTKLRSFNRSKNATPMFSNYFTIGYRQLIRHKLFSLVNIFGLAIGIATCLLIVQYVLFETSYDDFHNNGSRIYRVSDIVQRPGQDPIHQATNHHGTGPALKAELPEVKDFARIVHQSIFMGDVMAWSYDDGKGNVKVFNEEHVYDADQSLLTMFSFPLLYGDPETALADPTSVVLSESISHKYFGAENPIGKTMRMNGFQSFTVTGVFKDVPQNSHLQFDILTSWFLKNGWRGQWEAADEFNWCEFYTYILLDENADPNALKSKLPEFVTKHIGVRNKEMNYKELFFMQPIMDIHLNAPHMIKEQELHGSQQMIYFLLLIAGLILVIAWINYINLSTCKSIERAQEVGIRKVAGATKQQLIFQFLFESSTINFFSITLAIILVALALPYFNQLTGKDIGGGLMYFHAISEPWLWLMLLLVFTLGSFGAGLYPAFILSSFRIVTVLKGKFFGSTSGIVVRKVLVGSQFVISVTLIAGTIIVFRQVSFMRNEELGYVKEQLLIVKSPLVADSTFGDRLLSFKTELKRNRGIHSVAPTSEIPGKLISQVNNIRNIKEGTEGNIAAYHFYIDAEFVGTYGLEIKAGRNFFDQESFG